MGTAPMLLERVRKLEDVLREVRRIINDPRTGTFSNRLDLIDRATADCQFCAPDEKCALHL